MVSRALQVKKDRASHKPQRNTLWLGFSHLFPVASDWSRNGPMVHIWQMKQKERSVGRLPVIVLPGKKKNPQKFTGRKQFTSAFPFCFECVFDMSSYNNHEVAKGGRTRQRRVWVLNDITALLTDLGEKI